MSRLPHHQSGNGRVEHFEDFTSLKWCQDLLSDLSITRIDKRRIPNERDDVSNTFFIQTLFTDGAVRAYLSLYKPSKDEGEHQNKAILNGDVFSGDASSGQNQITKQQQSSILSKEEQLWSATDPDTAEVCLLISLGSDADGGARRLHGGVTATLLDQNMGTLVSHTYDNTCATADLYVKYKSAVTTPCVLLCRAKIVRKKGRWIESVGWIEDGQGKVLAEGKGAFVLNKKAMTAAAKI
jgi:acyl-coenzyme A thioesterase PaaI-like protein